MLDKISSALQAVGRFIREQWQEAKEEEQMLQELKVKQENQMQKLAMHNFIYSMMQKMTYDLFEVFQYQRYPRLEQVRTVADIRISNYKIQKNKVLYCFKIDKKTAEQLMSCEISQILTNTNTDISSHRVRLFHLYGTNIYQYFPFLARGIRVVAVKDLGLDVEIIVETVISPQELYEEYRQTPSIFTDI